MGFLSVLVAAAAGEVFGALWYMAFAKPWTATSGIKCGEDGRPKDNSPLPFILAAIAMILVAGMMRQTFPFVRHRNLWKRLLSGMGIGLFFISPWIIIGNAYGMRPFKLTVIDSGYAVVGCAMMGAVLGMF